MKRIVSLMLIAAMLFAVSSGCGENAAADATSVSTQNPVSEVVEASVDNQPQEQSTPTAVTSEVAVVEDTPQVTINYPLADGDATLVVWNPLAGWLTAMFGATSWTELPMGKKIEEAKRQFLVISLRLSIFMRKRELYIHDGMTCSKTSLHCLQTIGQRYIVS